VAGHRGTQLGDGGARGRVAWFRWSHQDSGITPGDRTVRPPRPGTHRRSVPQSIHLRPCHGIWGPVLLGVSRRGAPDALHQGPGETIDGGHRARARRSRARHGHCFLPRGRSMGSPHRPRVSVRDSAKYIRAVQRPRRRSEESQAGRPAPGCRSRPAACLCRPRALRLLPFGDRRDAWDDGRAGGHHGIPGALVLSHGSDEVEGEPGLDPLPNGRRCERHQQYAGRLWKVFSNRRHLYIATALERSMGVEGVPGRRRGWNLLSGVSVGLGPRCCAGRLPLAVLQPDCFSARERRGFSRRVAPCDARDHGGDTAPDRSRRGEHGRRRLAGGAPDRALRVVRTWRRSCSVWACCKSGTC
jgi:hypothetical protein